MGDNGIGSSGASSGDESLSSEPEPTVTLAKICMIEGNGQILDWDGKDPKDNRLFVYAHIGNTTYKSYMPKNNGYIYDSDFNSMRAQQHDPKGASFLHCSSGSIILPLMQGAHYDTGPSQSNCRIYHDKENKIWYKLNKECYQCDTEVSTNGFTSRHNILKIPNYSIRRSYESKMGAPCSIGNNYTPLTEYVTGKELYLFVREIRQTSTSGRTRRKIRKPNPIITEIQKTSTSIRPRSESPSEASSISEQQPSKRPRTEGGGKTRRKCKVKKRRNRRRRNTMKRRKTTAKRRYR